MSDNEEELKKSEEKFRLIANNSIDCIWQLDKQLRFTYLSPSLYEMSGFKPEEWIGTRLSAHTTWSEFFKMGRIALKMLKNYKTFDHVTFETKMYGKDGTLAPLEIVAKPLISNGKLVGLQGSTRDISDRKEAERKLTESEKKFRALVDQAAEMLFLHDLRGNLIDVNKAAIKNTGYNRQELERMNVLDIDPEAQNRDDQHKYWQKLNPEDPAVTFEATHQRKDGSIYPAEVTLSKVMFLGETYILALARDITERKQAEEALQASLQEKNQLIRELYHRTKNNMQVIMSMLMLQEEFTDDEQAQNILQETVNRIQAMALVHQKLYQSQNLSRINLDEYIRDLAQLLAQTYHVTANHINLTFDLKPIPALIDIAIPCGLVLNELVSNAFKHAFFNKQKGTIHIELQRTNDEGMITLVVSDNGIGLPDNFDYRNSKTFGLPIIMAIVEHQLQGKMIFESENGLICRAQFQDSLYEERV